MWVPSLMELLNSSVCDMLGGNAVARATRGKRRSNGIITSDGVPGGASHMCDAGAPASHMCDNTPFPLRHALLTTNTFVFYSFHRSHALAAFISAVMTLDTDINKLRTVYWCSNMLVSWQYSFIFICVTKSKTILKLCLIFFTKRKPPDWIRRIFAEKDEKHVGLLSGWKPSDIANSSVKLAAGRQPASHRCYAVCGSPSVCNRLPISVILGPTFRFYRKLFGAKF